MLGDSVLAEGSREVVLLLVHRLVLRRDIFRDAGDEEQPLEMVPYLVFLCGPLSMSVNSWLADDSAVVPLPWMSSSIETSCL
jgi:hypothetical protein